MSATHVNDRPARYREVLQVREYRAILSADALSITGDQISRVAVASIVFVRSGSTLLLAAAFAVAYLPWLLGGPLLGPLADRYPRHLVLVRCDLSRALIVALLLIPGLPVGVLLGLLFAATMLAAPFEAARAAIVPDILPGDLYVTGMALSSLLFQAGQVTGLLGAGAALAVVGTRGAISLDVGTFLLSALIIRRGVAPRPAPAREPDEAPTSMFTDTVAGFKLVFTDPLLRSLVLLGWLGAACWVVPEGLALAEATRAGGGPVAGGTLLAAAPAGAVLGSLLYARLLRPTRRLQLMLPICLAGFLPLTASAWSPNLPATGLLWFLTGAGGCYQLAASAAFVQAVAHHTRGRAFAIAQTGLLVTQGLSLLTAGALATHLPPRTVVTLAGITGLLTIGTLTLRWPHRLSPPDSRICASDRG